ncbi:MAG: hypothetical protein CMO55_28955 [Verrucomicrobiales bacterium]|nr:hypothetical protein [Verrucomicrobiales bacterium]
MKQIPRPLAVFAAALLLSPFATVSWAGPIVIEDASFEGYSLSTPMTQEAPASYGAWSLIMGNSQIYTDGVSRAAQSGVDFLAMPVGNNPAGDPNQMGDNSVIIQELDGFIPGVEYRCTYYVCGFNSQAGLKFCNIEVSVLNEPGDLYGFFVGANTTFLGTEVNPWQKRSFTFTAPTKTGNLRIQVIRNNEDDVYPCFDSFSIDIVPKGRPKVKLKKPKGKRSTTSRSRIAIKGKVVGILPTEKVIVQVGRKKKMLTTSGAFRYRAKLKPGRNKIKVRAIDIAGTLGKVTKHKVLRE